MFTRQDYMDKVCTHRQYYGQFVTPYIKDMVKRKFGVEAIANALKNGDEYLNTLPLKQWDDFMPFIPESTFKQVRDTNELHARTLSTVVCITKEAARQLVEDNTK